MKREWILAIVASALAIIVALGLLRWFAPQLLGIPVDLQMVRVGEQVVPFFETVFSEKNFQSKSFIINDPYLSRAMPLYPDLGKVGPNDLLGFRNRQIPNIADVITIGDSQTYGVNAPLERTWPGFLMEAISANSNTHYSMAVGAWAAVDYWEAFQKALYFKPRVIVVAFYSGNDALGSFTRAYSRDRWKFFRSGEHLDAADVPEVVFPAPEEQWWRVRFADGVNTIFTPKLRLASNQDHPAVREGYRIMTEVASRIAAQAVKLGVVPVFTIIPTKEFVYAEKVRAENLAPPGDYAELIRGETANIERLAADISRLDGAYYVDVARALQQAALGPVALYPDDPDGHPRESGYRVVAEAIAPPVAKFLPPRPLGLKALAIEQGKFHIVLVGKREYWDFASIDIVEANGWVADEIQTIWPRDVATIPNGGIINVVDPERFGPQAFR